MLALRDSAILRLRVKSPDFASSVALSAVEGSLVPALSQLDRLGRHGDAYRLAALILLHNF